MSDFKELSPTETKGYGMAGLYDQIKATTEKAVLLPHHGQDLWFARKYLRIKAGRLYAPLAVLAGKRASERQQRATDLEDSETE
jgi:hypothetical protein